MANYTLSAVFKLKDEFSKNVDKINSKMKGLDRVTKTSKSAMENMKQGFKDNAEDIGKAFKFISGAAVAMGGAVAGAAWSSFKEYANLNQQLMKNKAISGATAEESAKLEKQVKDLGATTAFTAKEVAEAQQYQIMAGYDVNKVLETTPKLLKLAIAAGSDLATTSDIITDSMDALGLKANELDKFLDIMTATANSTNTSVEMLGQSFKYVAPVSKAMGERVEDVAVMLGLLANNGIKSEQAGTALRGMYSRLAKPTKEMVTQFEKTNTKLYDSQGKFKGLMRIIQEAKPKLDKMTEAQRNEWIATVAGTEGLTAYNAIANTTQETMNKVKGSIEGSTGALEKQVKTLENTPLQKIKEMESAYEGLRLKFGEAVAPVMLEYMQELTKAMGELKTEDIKAFVDDAKVLFDGLAFTINSIVTALKVMKDAMEFNLKIGKGLGNIAQDVATFGITANSRKNLIQDINDQTDAQGLPRMDLSSITSSKSELKTILEELQLQAIKNNANNIDNNTTNDNRTNNYFEKDNTKSEARKVEVKIDMSNMKIDGGVTKEDVSNIINNAVGRWELNLSDSLNLGGAF